LRTTPILLLGDVDASPHIRLPIRMEIGGHNEVPDWPKMAPSLLIATCLIVAVRTARWLATIDIRNSNCELDREIRFAADVAQRLLSKLEAEHPSTFPTRKRLWSKATSDDSPP